MSINKKNCSIVAEELVSELINNITGCNEEWLFGKKPSDYVMIGNLESNHDEISFVEGMDLDAKQLRSIPSLGMLFRVDKTVEKVKLYIKGKFFYRVRPSFEDQVKLLLAKYSKSENVNFASYEELQDYIENKNPDIKNNKEELVFISKSIDLKDLGYFEFNLDKPKEEFKQLNETINERLNHKIDEIKDVSVGYKSTNRNLELFLNKESFEQLLKATEVPTFPVWKLNININITEYEEYKEVLIQLENKTSEINKYNTYETALFNAGVKVSSEKGFKGIKLNSYKHYYLDDPTLPAMGKNCSVIQNDNTIETENIPIFRQKRVKTIDKFNEYVEFTKLIEDPISNLSYLYDEMNKTYNKYLKDLEKEKNERDFKYYSCYEQEVRDFGFEINRFKHGIELINSKSSVREAFYLMNKTFSLNKKYKGWRMFQIVFIVSEIADMIQCEYKETPGFVCQDIDNVDLIYFPTGGGKTETFLGCVIFSAFFDRIRGKENGVTSIIKYPLRLLAAQQLDRVLSLVINANVIKKEHKISGDDFSVGFYTGSKNTPNKIDDKKKMEMDGIDLIDLNKRYRQIDYCPICGAEMNISFDDSSWSLRHTCSNNECNFIPPIYIVDDEIYRFSPTVVISTIDKMANVGTSLGFKSLFGQAEYYCKNHGFIPQGNKCFISNCKCEIERKERKDPVPTLLIQDEMHLVNESLGTFDSHYESLIQYYCEKLIPIEQRKKIKYIGATATIADYKKHIRGLYNKDAKQFPTSIKKENFYSYIDEDDVSRIILGAALYGASITESIQKLVTYMRIIVSDWMNKLDVKLIMLKNKGFVGEEVDLHEILHYYLISIIYNNSKNDAGKVRSILENQGNTALRSDGVNPFDIAEITGDVDFKVIKDVMHNVESDKNKFNTKNVIISTSAISHGVDEDTFNQIYFFGMPNRTAEYIQAYSRVGRFCTGIVFDIFRIIRDRDKSYLKNFYNFHYYKDILIDPVPINRFAKNAIYSTLPGIIAALLYHHYVKKYKAIDVTKKIISKELLLDNLLNDLFNIFDCDSQDSQLYKEIIQDETTLIFNAFAANTNSEISISDLIKSSNSKHKGPMTNLRDVDVPIEVRMGGY